MIRHSAVLRSTHVFYVQTENTKTACIFKPVPPTEWTGILPTNSDMCVDTPLKWIHTILWPCKAYTKRRHFVCRMSGKERAFCWHAAPFRLRNAVSYTEWTFRFCFFFLFAVSRCECPFCVWKVQYCGVPTFFRSEPKNRDGEDQGSERIGADRSRKFSRLLRSAKERSSHLQSVGAQGSAPLRKPLR
jgi:hypothetical protein